MFKDRTIDKYAALVGKTDAVIMGIESSCDETAVAIVRSGREVLSNVIATQIPIHRRFGGVVPEVASRNHTLAILGTVDEALAKAHMTHDDIDAIAVTYGAGLIGALLVGVSTAKALAFAWDKPLIKVNHIQGHICASYAEFKELAPPFTALVASGGHTSIMEVSDYNTYRIIGETLDDAIGEAFDKVARLMGLPYPGGPEVDKLAREGQANINFFKHAKSTNKEHTLSYSGLKTAVVNYVHNLQQKGEKPNVNDVCASFTKCAVDLLVRTTMDAALETGYDKIVLAGGVACNSYLRTSLCEAGNRAGIQVYFPSPVLCTDNGAMIAVRGYYSAIVGSDHADMTLNAVSNI